MEYGMIPAVQAVAEYMPPKKDGPFEKFMEVAHLILDHEPVNAITHTAECAIQTFGMIRETKYRTQAFQYAAHLEEVRIQAAVEMARLRRGEAVRLYIDRQFQNALDEMERSYLEQSSALTNYGTRMMREIDRRVAAAHRGIDLRYVNTIRENEMKCAMYRDFTDHAAREGVELQDVTRLLIRSLAENMNRYDGRTVSDVCIVIQEAMRHSKTVPFEEYLEMEQTIRKKKV